MTNSEFAGFIVRVLELLLVGGERFRASTNVVQHDSNKRERVCSPARIVVEGVSNRLVVEDDFQRGRFVEQLLLAGIVFSRRHLCSRDAREMLKGRMTFVAYVRARCCSLHLHLHARGKR